MIMVQAILAAHIAIILFNVFGLVAVPLGAICDWRFVHILWWRVLHLLSLAAVAAQALAGRACFLTIWQDDLAGVQTATPLIVRLIDQLIYWRLPMWVFATLYALIFSYSLALFWLVPPESPRSARPKSA